MSPIVGVLISAGSRDWFGCDKKHKADRVIAVSSPPFLSVGAVTSWVPVVDIILDFSEFIGQYL